MERLEYGDNVTLDINGVIRMETKHFDKHLDKSKTGRKTLSKNHVDIICIFFLFLGIDA